MKEAMRALARRLLPEKHYLAVLQAAKRLYYFGVSRQCPVCGGSFRRFLPGGLDLPVFQEKKVVGGGLAAEVVCPGCWSLNRERLLLLYLRQQTRIFDVKTRLLHISPEPGLSKVLRDADTIQYISADLGAPNVMIHSDLASLPLRSAQCDVVICCHVLEHVGDDRAAMREILRVLKPSGWAILQVPIALSEPETFEDPSITSADRRECLYGQKDHVRLYGRDYQDRLQAAGFRVQRYRYATDLGIEAVVRHGVLADEEIYIGHKDPAAA